MNIKNTIQALILMIIASMIELKFPNYRSDITLMLGLAIGRYSWPYERNN